MKRLILCLTLLLTLIPTVKVAALDVVQAPADLKTSPILITGYQVMDGGVGFIQIYNNSTQLVLLDGWQLGWILTDEAGAATDIKVPLQNWLPGEQYAIVAESSLINEADIQFTLSGSKGGTISALKIIPPPGEYSSYTSKADLSATGRYAMEQTTAGNFTASRPFIKADDSLPLYGNGLYQPAKSTVLKIVEIFANPRQCSPQDAEQDLTCNDYIKLQNPTNTPIVLDDYRLRLGWGNENASLTNSFALSGTLKPGKYYTVAMRDDQQPLNITSSGGYVWVEDFYGIVKYTNTIYKYPDLGDEAYRDFSWALNESGQWQWGVPSPGTANNFSRQPNMSESKTASSELKPCNEGQERNPDTNRCRNISTTASTLTPCKAGQERNPDTNRCRNIASSQSTLKPCEPGQERNPETNRCRKVAGAATDLPGIQDIQSTPSGRDYRWWIVGSALGGAVIFGAWEWRHDIASLVTRLKKPGGSPPQ